MRAQRPQGRRVWLTVTVAWVLSLMLSAPATTALTPGSAGVAAYGQATLSDDAPNHGLVSAAAMTFPSAAALDDAGGAYIADTANHRVLFFPPASAVATRVYGQPDFASDRANNDGNAGEGPPAPATLNEPRALALAPDGLYIADSGNHRVLFFPGDSTAPTRVYGQPDFASNASNNDGTGASGAPSARNLAFPSALAVSAAGLYVAERDNARVLFFPAPAEGTRRARAPLAIPTATRVYGKASFATADDTGPVDAHTMSYPSGLAVDATGLYVADTNLERVVFFPAGGPAVDPPATRVYGQATLGPPDASFDTSERTMRNPWGIAVTAAGLYVADSLNSRVLFFPHGGPAVAPAATVVYGQADFSADEPNNGDGNEGRPSAASLARPDGVAVSAAGVLIVDTFNHRALRYPLNSTTATRVYGQPSFAANLFNAGQLDGSGLRYPRGVAVDADNGVYIADGFNNRVLFFPPGATTASRVYGQPDFTSRRYRRTAANTLSFPSSVAVSAEGLYVADTFNSRVLFFPEGGPAADPLATRVYGQPDFTSNAPDNDGSNRSGDATAHTLDDPRSIAVDASGLYVADDNDRVVFFPQGAAAVNPAATRVYGQPDFVSAIANNDGSGRSGPPSASNLWEAQAIAPVASGVYLADPQNQRVLFFPGISTTATRVIGQPDFASKTRNNDGQGGEGGPSAQTLNYPLGLAGTVDGVYVADAGNNRVLFFPHNGPAGYPAATARFGQPDFASGVPNNDGQGAWRRPNAINLSGPWGLALDHDGRLLVADTDNTRVLTVEDPVGGLALSAPDALAAGQPASFAASVGQGSGVRYRWSFGDGSVTEGATASHTYATAGTYTIAVQAANRLGTTSATREVRVLAAPASVSRYRCLIPFVTE